PKPEGRAENSEPECGVSGCGNGDRDFAREHFWKSCHEPTPVSTVLLLTSAQSKILKCVRREIPGYPEPLAALVARDSSPCLRTDNAVDLSAIITLSRESLLR